MKKASIKCQLYIPMPHHHFLQTIRTFFFNHYTFLTWFLVKRNSNARDRQVYTCSLLYGIISRRVLWKIFGYNDNENAPS